MENDLQPFISRSGVCIPVTGASSSFVLDTKRGLTVQPHRTDFGQPQSFRVYREANHVLCVPQFSDVARTRAKVDRRPQPARMHPGVKFVGTLRDVTRQNEAFQAAVNAGHGLLSLPCGYGKTTVALAIACHMGWRTMIVVHKEFLATQWRERIQQFCPRARVGIVQQDRCIVDECDFVVAMLQTLSQRRYRFDAFESVGTLFVDEAHHICARTFSQSLFRLCPRHAYGLSATPDRRDGLACVLHWFLGPTVFRVERECRQQVHVRVVYFEHVHFREQEVPTMRVQGGKTVTSMAGILDALVSLHERQTALLDIVCEAVDADGRRQMLVLTDRRAHCYALREALQARGVSVGLYIGGMKKADLEDTAKNKRVIVATYAQANEGLDIPRLNGLVLATPKADVKQAVGRILRDASSSIPPTIWDVFDQWGGMLANMFWKRHRLYREEGFTLVRGTQITKKPKLSVVGDFILAP